MKFNFKAILIFILLIGFILPIFGFCQEEDLIQEPKLKAVAGKDRNIVVNRKIVFSAIGSVTENVSKVEYNWDFGDGYKGQGEEVTHVYNNSGVYRVKLNMKADSEAGQLKNSDEIIVNVDKDIFVLISDNEVSEEELKTISDMASSQGILVADIKEAEDSAGYIAEKELADKIIKNKEDIRQAGSIVIWTKQDLGLNALLETAQSLSKNDTSFGFNNKYFVVITDQNFTVTAKLAQSLYNILEPQFIVLARPEAKNKIFSNSDLNSLLQDLRKDNSEYRLLGLHSKREASELKPWNFLSFFVGFMVDRGVPLNTIYLILILPVIATVMAFSRQIIGLKALGIYTPSIVAVSFLVTGLKYGLTLFIVTLLVGTLGRLLARKVRLAYLPRMAIVLTLVSFAIFSFFMVGTFFGKSGLIEISIFPILVMVLLTEKFITVQIERGSKAAVIIVVETLLLSIVCYWLASWQSLKILILGYPEFVLLTVVFNYLIGRWPGLRLTEYYRFRKVIKNVELSEEK